MEGVCRQDMAAEVGWVHLMEPFKWQTEDYVLCLVAGGVFEHFEQEIHGGEERITDVES